MRHSLDWKKTLDLFFLDTVQRRMVVVTQVFLLVLLAALLASLTWKFMPYSQLQISAPPLPRSSAVLTSAGPAEGRSWDIARWELFGPKPTASPVEDAVAVESLPETTLNLVLRGVIASDRAGQDSGAIIGVPGGIEAFYAIDGRLPGGALLREVYPDRVVLERGGRLETLRLPKEFLEDTGVARPAVTQRPMRQQSSAGSAVTVDGGQQQSSTSPPRQRAAASRPGSSSPSTPSVPSQEALSLREYRDIALNDPQQLNDMIQLSPKADGDEFLGYEIQPGRDTAFINRVGLLPGDIVTSVNGIALDSPARALGVLRTLSDATEVNIAIQRDGIPQSLTISIGD